MDRDTPLVPSDAAAAIIVVADRYLLQLRDAKPGIFFPGQWGCFGGALEGAESEQDALARELREEIGAAIPPEKLEYFSRFVIDFEFARRGEFFRAFYELSLTPAEVQGLRLGEGSAMRLFDAESILAGTVPITPFDSFALWLHISQRRLSPTIASEK